MPKQSCSRQACQTRQQGLKSAAQEQHRSLETSRQAQAAAWIFPSSLAGVHVLRQAACLTSCTSHILFRRELSQTCTPRLRNGLNVARGGWLTLLLVLRRLDSTLQCLYNTNLRAHSLSVCLDSQPACQFIIVWSRSQFSSLRPQLLSLLHT